MIVCIAHPLSDLLNLDFRIQKQLPGMFHAYLKDIFIDAAVISGFELAGQIFFGKEIFVGKLGDLNVAAIVIVDPISIHPFIKTYSFLLYHKFTQKTIGKIIALLKKEC